MDHLLKLQTDEAKVQHQEHFDDPLPERPLLQPPQGMHHCLLSIDKKRRNAVFTMNDEEAMALSFELEDQLYAMFLTDVGLL